MNSTLASKKRPKQSKSSLKYFSNTLFYDKKAIFSYPSLLQNSWGQKFINDSIIQQNFILEDWLE